MSLIEIRKRSLTVETIYHEGGPPAQQPLRVVAPDGRLSEPLAGLPPVDAGGQGGLLDVITDRSKRLLCCAIALDICKADSAISDPEMLLLRHMMQHWQLSLEDLENEFIRQ